MKRRSTACASFQHTSFNRRTLLKAGGMGLLGLTMPKILQARALEQSRKLAPKAKSVIFLFQFGGPSHLDMFDMKPDAPSEYRSPHQMRRTNCLDIEINARMPEMAKHMDKVTVIRSLHHKMNNHNSASYYALSGHAPPTDDQRLRDTIDLYPAYGSVVDKLAPGTDPALPTFVSYPYHIGDGSRTPGQSASFLGKRHDPLFIPRDPNETNFQLPELSLPDGLTMDRLQSRRGLQQLIDQQSRLLDHAAEAQGLDAYYAKALSMLHSPRVRQAFDLSKEPAALRDRYGRTTYGQGCLLARRLVESGVKFTTVYFSRSIGGRSTTDGGWDTRMYPIIEDYHLPITDQTLPTLLTDLTMRGLLDETLVIWMGEFGRTPKINKNASRDHWPHCYSVLLAGGGVKGGYVYGASDKLGEHPAEDPVTPEDLAATIYHLLGIDSTAVIVDRQDRPLPISSGNPIHDVIA
jgi:hypothetical protein